MHVKTVNREQLATSWFWTHNKCVLVGKQVLLDGGWDTCYLSVGV